MSDGTNPISPASTVDPNRAGGVSPTGALQAPQAAKPGKTTQPGTDSLTLSPAAKALVAKLQARDADVRAHEEAHIAAGGSLVTGGPSFTYEKGPDGRTYAVGGEVSIDSSPVKGNPKATVAKELQVEAAALAPADPSGQDLAVAASAAAAAAQAEAQVTAQAVQGNQGPNKQAGTSGAKGSGGIQGGAGQTGAAAQAPAGSAAQPPVPGTQGSVPAATGNGQKPAPASGAPGAAPRTGANGQGTPATQRANQAYNLNGNSRGNQARRPGSLVDTLG